jgi:ribonuclease HIII
MSPMPKKTSFTYALDAGQQASLKALLASGALRPIVPPPHAEAAAEATDCRIVLYRSGKCVVQGRGAEDWVLYALEPGILGRAELGYESALNPESATPHMGIDESGKGDFFGPLVVAAAYCDESLAKEFDEAGVRDSKRVSSDKKILALDQIIRTRLRGRFALVPIGPAAYNRLYESMGNVNRLLAWGHARAIENLLERVPDCPRAVADQFGPKHRIERALMKNGKAILLEQRPRAESDPAVAAASILARAAFVNALRKMGEDLGVEIPKGASARVRETAVRLVRERGPDILGKFTKMHFRTSGQVLAEAGCGQVDDGVVQSE